VGLIPFTHLVPLPVGAAERFLYLPSVGIAIAAAIGMERIFDVCPRITVGVAVCVLSAMLATTVRRSGHFRSNLTLQQRAVQDFPQSFNAHYTLGRLYAERGQLHSALRELRRANRLLPNILPNVVLMSELLIKRGQASQAWALLDQAMQELGPLPILLRLRKAAK